MARKNKVVDPWEDAAEVPRADTPSRGTSPWRRVATKALVWSCLICFVLLSLFTLSKLVETEDSSPVVETSSADPARVAAARAVTAWLAANPSPLPGGKILSYDGAVTQPRPPAGPNAPKDAVLVNVRVVSFTLTDANGVAYRSSVAVHIDGRGSATVASSPSLIRLPENAADQWEVDSPWPGYESSTTTEEVDKAIAGWAQAYTSGDPSQLRLAVGDTDASHYYVPLKGASLFSTKPQAATDLGGGSWAVQVQMQLRWKDQPKAADKLQPMTLDVLVQRADTVAPIVVAWGDPGTGVGLKPMENALPDLGRTQAGVASRDETTKER